MDAVVDLDLLPRTVNARLDPGVGLVGIFQASQQSVMQRQVAPVHCPAVDIDALDRVLGLRRAEMQPCSEIPL
ncbi:hypothetical protein D9M71_832600 [compost metagenome]